MNILARFTSDVSPVTDSQDTPLLFSQSVSAWHLARNGEKITVLRSVEFIRSSISWSLGRSVSVCTSPPDSARTQPHRSWRQRLTQEDCCCTVITLPRNSAIMESCKSLTAFLISAVGSAYCASVVTCGRSSTSLASNLMAGLSMPFIMASASGRLAHSYMLTLY